MESEARASRAEALADTLRLVRNLLAIAGTVSLVLRLAGEVAALRRGPPEEET